MENRINIGELDTLVTIQRCTIGHGTQGQKTYTFADYGKVFAKVDRQVDEVVNNTNLEEGQNVSLTCYKIAELTTRWRVIIDGRRYAITAIDPVSRVSPLNILSLHAVDDA